MHGSRRRRRVLVVSTVAAGVIAAAAFFSLSSASASVSTQVQAAEDLRGNCDLLARNSTGAQQARAQACVADQTAIIALLTRGTPTPTAVPTTVRPSTTTAAPAPTATTPPRVSAFPDAGNTGVPAGVTLTAYSGPCLISAAGTVIDGKTVNCDLRVTTTGVVIRNSRIMGTVSGSDQGTSFSITDSEVIVGTRTTETTGISTANFSVARVEVTGGNRGILCNNACDVRDSYIHGTQVIEDWHASAVRMQTHLTLVHNTLVCDAPQVPPRGGLERGSCSASLTGYGDWEPGVQDNLIQGNYFAATQYAAYCAYGGSSTGKPYTDATRNIVFRDNVFAKAGDCALYGPIGDWDPSKPGNVWENNTFDDGTLIPNRRS